MAQKVKTIKQKELIPGVKPEDVYLALVNAKKHAAFTGAAATGAARAGGKFTAWDGYISGKFLELDPPKRVLQEWITAEWPADSPPSLVEWKLVQKKAGTEVTLTHSKVPEAQVESYSTGWVAYYWTPLKAYFQPKE